MATNVNLVVAADVNLTCYEEDSFQMTLTFTDDTNTPIDLSNATLKMQVRKTETYPSVDFEMTEGSGITVGGVGNNVVTFNKIATIKGGNYEYDLQATYTDGTVVTYLKGNFIVVKDVTQ